MLHCSLCTATVPTVGEAIEKEWSPSCWIDDVETGDPVCPHCIRARCRIDDDGEYVLAKDDAGCAV